MPNPTDLPSIRVVSAIIERDGRFLVAQRRADARLPLLWEFPGGKVEPGETDQEALARELMERLGLEVAVEDMELQVDHAYSTYRIDLRVWRCRIEGGEPRPLRVAALLWATPEDLSGLSFPGADQASVDALIADL
ncbi:MAG: (deoxy)nucleoside triphosphate pyrophosphohydrolase [Pseudomonadota bacterium]